VGVSVFALAVLGNDLYAAGSFTTAGGVSANSIAKWNGSSWSALGSGMGFFPIPLCAGAAAGRRPVCEAGSRNAGGSAANYTDKWNGSSWSPLGSGMGGDYNYPFVYVSALAVSGSDLYAGGNFTTAGGKPANRIAKWNGSSWSALGSGMNNLVWALAVSGSDL
jgi:hypothetical protein